VSWNDEPPQAAPAAGWYTDPGGSGGLRYWDGRMWTGHVTEPRPPAPPPGYAPPGPPPPYAAAPAGSRTPVWVWILVALVALSVVVGGIAAVAVPAFRIARDAVWDEEAQLAVADVHAAAVGLRGAGTSGFLNVTAEALAFEEPFVEHTTEASDGPDVVSHWVLADSMTFAVRSESGTCWVVRSRALGDGTIQDERGRVRDGQPCLAATVGRLTLEDF
jgi:hypothetical protein